jgi:uncharacterized protein (DUF433 family)
VARKIDLYGGADPRNLPSYTVGTAAGYLRLPASTLRSWALGATFTTARGKRRRTQALITPAGRDPLQLSFWNLVESQVLACIRKVHGIKMNRVRRALDFIERHLGQRRPLISADFQTDGVTLFVEHLGEVVDVGTRGGPQLVLQMISATLQRIERDEAGLAARIFPWVNHPEEPRFVVLDPLRSFGRPVVIGTRIPADALAERFAGGESIADLSRDFDLAHEVVEYAVRWGSRSVGVA